MNIINKHYKWTLQMDMKMDNKNGQKNGHKRTLQMDITYGRLECSLIKDMRKGPR